MYLGKFELTDEMMEKVKQAESAEEILKLAEEYGISLTEDDVKQVQAFMSEGELSEDELDSVAGGKGRPAAKYQVGQRVKAYHGTSCSYQEGTITFSKFVELQNSWYYTVLFGDGSDLNYPESSVYPL